VVNKRTDTDILSYTLPNLVEVELAAA